MPTILAIRPGNRKMGLAVFEGMDLVFWGVAGLRNIEPEKILDAVEHRLRSLIAIYGPTVIALEKPSITREKTCPLLEDILVRISRTTLDAMLYYQLYSLPTVKEHLCHTRRATRQDMIQKVIASYPHLSRYTGKVSKWQEAYWMPMFAAVALGMTCIQK